MAQVMPPLGEQAGLESIFCLRLRISQFPRGDDDDDHEDDDDDDGYNFN